MPPGLAAGLAHPRPTCCARRPGWRTRDASLLPRPRPLPSGAARLPPLRRTAPSCAAPLRSSASAPSGCGSGRSSAPSRASAGGRGWFPFRGRTRVVAAEAPGTPLSRWPGPLRRRRRPDSRQGVTRRARSRRAALAPSRPAAGRPAGAAMASFEDDQDLALLDDLALFDADLLHGAGAGSRDRNLHLHRLEDEQLVLLGDLCAGLRPDLPHAAHQLSFDFSHLPLKQRILRASSIVATERPKSRARRAALSTSSPLLFAIRS